ncbi:hypothetical protein O181_086981 [Austropuccinia psidii MF-1]|uniref:Uncharacterized protein n=1 Tax=Austropuccinia psidii MF-1 TaxID=1389203 RepID=A0A9Q3P4Q0_9BASI|nr:hypothetical protein [Austropuccinia psidii MF-1]
MVERPSLPSFGCDFLVIHTPKEEYLILDFDFLNHSNPSIDWRKGLITFNPDYKDSSDSFIPLSNEVNTAATCAALVGDSRAPSFPTSVHIPSLMWTFLLHLIMTPWRSFGMKGKIKKKLKL